MANTNDGLHINDGNDVINLFKYPSAMSLALSILWVDHVKSTRNSLESPIGRAWRDALAFRTFTDPRMTLTEAQFSRIKTRDLNHLLSDRFHATSQRGILVQTGVREV